MVISLYKTNSDYRKLDKVLSATVSATGSLHERVSDTLIRVKVPGSLFSAVSGSNYAHVDTFGKYYFMEPYEVENNCIILNLKEDVRKNFSAKIKSLQITVSRNQFDFNGYLNDPKYSALSYEAVQYKTFPNSLDDSTCVLVTVG